MLPPSIGPLVRRGAEEINRAVTGFNDKPGRGLTSGEIRLASSIYGTLVKYEKVKVFNARWHEYMPEGRAHAPNGNIYFDSKAGYTTDFSTASLDQRSTFIHEMGHVWQHQRGENVILKVVYQAGSSSYKYAHIFGDQWKAATSGKGYHSQVPGKGLVHVFFFLPLEAQAEFMSDYYRLKNGHRAEAGYNKGFGRSEYERLMPPQLRATAISPALTS